MGRDNELRMREVRLQELTEVIPMACIHGHNDIVQERDRESVAEEPFHEREVETDAHAVLMTLAVVRARRKQTAFVKVHVKIEPPLAWRELRGELGLIALVDGSI